MAKRTRKSTKWAVKEISSGMTLHIFDDVTEATNWMVDFCRTQKISTFNYTVESCRI